MSSTCLSKRIVVVRFQRNNTDLIRVSVVEEPKMSHKVGLSEIIT